MEKHIFVLFRKLNVQLKMLEISRKIWKKYQYLNIDSQNSTGGILTLWNLQKFNLIFDRNLQVSIYQWNCK
jgi:hypothetical protein